MSTILATIEALIDDMHHVEVALPAGWIRMLVAVVNAAEPLAQSDHCSRYPAGPCWADPKDEECPSCLLFLAIVDLAWAEDEGAASCRAATLLTCSSVRTRTTWPT